MIESDLKIHSIKYNLVMNAILKLSTMIFPLITFPYISRVLGVLENGRFSFASAVISYAKMAALLGVPTYGIRVCAQCRDDKLMLSKTVHELLVLSTVSSFIVYVTTITLAFFIPKLSQNRELIVVLSLSIPLSCFGVEWFYQAIEQYQYITLRNLLFKIIALVVMFLTVKDSDDVLLYGIVTLIGTVGANVWNLVRLKKYIILKPFSDYRIDTHIRPVFIFFLLTAASLIYSNLDTIMVGFLKSEREVGLYTAAVKIRSMLLGLINALATVLLPRVSYYYKTGQNSRFEHITQIAVYAVFFFSIPCIFFFSFYAKETILVIAGNEYIEAIYPMIFLLPTVLVAGLNNITGLQVLGAIGLEKKTMFSTIIGALVDLIANFLLIPRFGAAGAAIGTLTAEIVVFAVQVVTVNKYFKIWPLFRDIIKIFLASILSLVISFLFGKYVIIQSVFIGYIIYVGIFGICYLFLIFILKPTIKLNRELR